eukprot:CAMPEP_0170059922 /NCGR_PEP_ID=MMETSP0019_2-20121128/2031_1 /TAXON_ID=98059 /ORGANISM="Dinobryon sp., Strain UTEXLB2267" /LENGTH=467 /DNA_ID=CAMNT_0010265319 /DNA_START=2439 /DNA_END=3842 /DNA_ORIENTATION=+
MDNDQKIEQGQKERSKIDMGDEIDKLIFKAADTLLTVILEKAAPCIFFYITAKLLLQQLVKTTQEVVSVIHSHSNESSEAKIPTSIYLSNITRFFPTNTTLTIHELEVLTNGVVDPATIADNLQELGGLEATKQSVLSLCKQLNSTLTNTRPFVPTSLLLFGPPGCGKSVLVRALCRQQNVPMIQVTPSLLLRKYVGETSQMTKSIFTLASKLQPCIMFVDEMDSLLRARTSDDTSVDRNIKTEFMQLWDDLARSGTKVVVIGSTNRPQDLDAAIQRRFERSFLLGLPDLAARTDIFRRTLTGCSLHPSLKEFDFQQCAALTEGYSSSDLRALCKAALQLCESSDIFEGDTVDKLSPRISEGMGRLRPLTLDDVKLAVKSFYPTTWAANSFESLSGAPLFTSPPTASSDGVGAGITPKWDWTQRTSSFSKPFDTTSTSGNSSYKKDDFEEDDDEDDDDDDEGGDCVE